MTRLPVFVNRMLALLTGRRADAALQNEVQAHLDLLATAHVRSGLSPQAACEAALRDFGGVESMKDRCRDERRFNWLDNFTRDLRFGVRMVARRPGLLVIVVLTMALGIGINTAVFGLMRALVLSPLPVPEPDRIRGIIGNRMARWLAAQDADELLVSRH